MLLILANPVIAAGKGSVEWNALTASQMAAFKAMATEYDPPINLTDMRMFTIAAWPAATQSGLFIAAMGSEPDNFNVAVLKANGSSWTVVAATNTNNDAAVDPAMLRDLEIDVIPYSISKNEIAFGVRASTDFDSTSTSVAATSLHLFRLDNDKLEDIFASDVDSFECDKTRQDSDCSPEKKSIVQFAPTQHEVHYDILVKPAKGSVGKPRHFVWKHGAYVSIGSGSTP